MKYDNQEITEELFPNFSSFDRAINYPYFAPNYSFSFHKGKFVKGICDDLANRIPVLSVGSNRSPYQLKRKMKRLTSPVSSSQAAPTCPGPC